VFSSIAEVFSVVKCAHSKPKNKFMLSTNCARLSLVVTENDNLFLSYCKFKPKLTANSCGLMME